MKIYIVAAIEEFWEKWFPGDPLTESITDKALRICSPEDFFK